jgi:hypothetical protein
MKAIWTIIATIVFTIFSGFVYANDSTARVGAGGITLLKSSDIRIIQENLKISKKAIHVHYRFINDSDQDILTTVAFPMPPYGWNPGVSAFDENVKPLESFVVVINGSEVKTAKTRRALIGQRDVTDQLRTAGLSEAQIFKTFGDMTLERGHGLSKLQVAKLGEIGAFKNAPTWKVAEIAYWEQLFPTKKVIEVEHTYKPFVGSVYSVPYQEKYGFVSGIPTVWDKDSREACLDKATRRAIGKKVKSLVDRGASSVWVYLDDVEYILGTGRNWKGPITDFTLLIEKESPDQLVSVCFPGKPNIVNPATLEFKHINFVPQNELVVYFYTVKAE